MNKFPLSNLKIAFAIATTKRLNNSAMTIYYPLPNTKKKIIAIFLGLILDSRSIIGDVSKDTYRLVLIMLLVYVLHCCLKTIYTDLKLFVQCDGIQSQFRFTNYWYMWIYSRLPENKIFKYRIICSIAIFNFWYFLRWVYSMWWYSIAILIYQLLIYVNIFTVAWKQNIQISNNLFNHHF